MKKLHHHTVWLPDELHMHLLGLEVSEHQRTGEEVGMSTLIRRIIREHADRCKPLDPQHSQAATAAQEQR